MKKTSMNLIKKAGILITATSLLLNTNSISVFAAGNSETGKLTFTAADELNVKSVATPESAQAYAESIVGTLLSNVAGNEEMYGVKIGDYDKLTLGQPYTIMSFNDTNEVYYFPVNENETVKLILSVNKVDGAWNASLSEDIADELNQLKQSSEKSDYVLYNNNGVLYAENSSDTVTLEDTTYRDKAPKINADSLSYDEKIDKFEEVAGSDLNTHNLLDAVDKTINPGQEAIEIKNDNNTAPLLGAAIGKLSDKPFSVDLTTGKSLNMTDCLVNQQDQKGTERGLCWAASTATVVRYTKGVKNIYAYDVANLMGIDYDDGATIPEIKSALAKYSLSYTASGNVLSFTQVKSSIDNKRPIIMGTSAGQYGHAVTIIGYSTKNNTNTFTIWNSGNQKTQVCTYRGTSSSFPYAGYVFYWDSTVY